MKMRSLIILQGFLSLLSTLGQFLLFESSNIALKCH